MDEDIEFVKPKERKYNRRSSFFQRSLSSYNSDSPTNPGTTETLQCNATTTLDRKTEYLNKLKKETEDWKALLNQKLKEEDELRTKCPQAASSMDFLTAEDRKFLEDRPDYVSIGRLVDSVTESVVIKQRRINSTKERVEHFITYCESVTNKLAGDVIESFMEEFNEVDNVILAN